MRTIGSILVGLVLAGGLSACGNATGDSGEVVGIVATTTMLGDVVANVVGDGATVEVLLPRGVDPHDYQASSRQVAAVERADLVVANGLGLEEGLRDVLENARADGARIIEVAPRLEPLSLGDGAGADPHVWFDPLRMADAARLIAAELAAIDSSRDWVVAAELYASELEAADQIIEDTLAAVPAEHRKLVTNHDSLQYFAARYGFDVIGAVVPGGSTLSDPSSAGLARLVEKLEQQNVPAIFAETTEPADLAEAIAAEADRQIDVVELYTGSLGEPGSGADTLIAMLIINAERVAGALEGSRQ